MSTPWVVFIVLNFILLFNLLPDVINGLEIVSKKQWEGRNPTERTSFKDKINYVIVHHSDTPACSNRQACSSRMRSMQNNHMVTKGWSDIGYNFAIGTNGEIYEGRGAGVVGAHAPGWNNRSYGIVFIGNYENNELNDSQVTAWQSLIKWLVDQDFLDSNYTLYAHRQVRATKCPGKNLFNTIKNWPQWKEKSKS